MSKQDIKTHLLKSMGIKLIKAVTYIFFSRLMKHFHGDRPLQLLLMTKNDDDNDH